MTKNLAASVHARLVRNAKALDVDPNVLLARYGAERLLYRLSRSQHADRFVLKGALLLLVWLGETTRPTRDADLLGFGEITEDSLQQTFTEVLKLPVQPDGLVFDPDSIQIAGIRPEGPYHGFRVTMLAYLGPARIRVQVDVGLGDAITPDPEPIEYPSLLELPRPRLRAYRPETAIAEKAHGMVTLGTMNSRMRDFFDVYVLAQHRSFDGPTLSRALRDTFERRDTTVTGTTPVALTAEFTAHEAKNAQWGGFLRRSRLSAPGTLHLVVESIATFLLPVLQAVADGRDLNATWPPGGPWEPKPR